MTSFTCPHCGNKLQPTKKPLTSKQAAVLGYIKSHIVLEGFAPTLQELADKYGNAISTTWATVDQLVKKGHVRKTARDWQAMEIL